MVYVNVLIPIPRGLGLGIFYSFCVIIVVFHSDYAGKELFVKLVIASNLAMKNAS